jgi:hypothetical protein
MESELTTGGLGNIQILNPIFSQEEVDAARRGIEKPILEINENNIIQARHNKEIGDRIVVIEQIYHQTKGQNPTNKKITIIRELKTDEQPYIRTTKATSEWSKLDTGWLIECSQLSIKNEDKEIEIFLGNPKFQSMSIRIKPGESCRIEPITLSEWYVSSTTGTPRYTISAYPI